jgi:hypothetical protein
LVGAGIVLALIAGGSPWWLSMVRPKVADSAPVAATQLPDAAPIASAPDTPTPTPPTGAPRSGGRNDDGGARPGSGDGSARPGLPGLPGRPGLPLPDANAVPKLVLAPRNLRVTRWLRGVLSNENSDQWVQIPVPDLGKVPPGATLKLLAGKESGLVATALEKDPGDGGIAVRLAKGGDGAVALRLKDSKLEGRRQSKPGDDLFDRLQFCVLQIESKLEIEQPARVVLTPPLPAVPLSETRSTHPAWERAGAFFDAAHQFRGPLNVRVRVDRVSLAVTLLSTPDGGWSLSPPADSPLGKELIKPLEIGWPPDGKCATAIHVISNNPREYPDRPALSAQLDPPSRARAEQGVEGGEDPSRIRPPGTKARPGAAALDPSSRSNGDRRDPQKAAIDPTLLFDVFRRYGLVHGAIVVRVMDPESKQEFDVEVLRFDNDSLRTTP